MAAKLESVRVGGVTYAVSFPARIVDTGDDGKLVELWGLVDYGDAKIEIADTGAQQNRQATVCHEIVHAILHQVGQDEHNENQVIALGYGLAQVIRDNPALIDYLRGEVDADAASGT